MVDLARQAFSTNNFDLAAEIYERSIRENGPRTDLYLGLANSFARSGNFRRAFEAYSSAFRLGPISCEQLRHLVTALIEAVKQEKTTLTAMTAKNVMFSCSICRSLLNDPVTISCGHSFCRTCLLKDSSKTCKLCGTVNHLLNVNRLKSTIILSRTIDKWFPSECKAARLKVEANSFFERRKFEDAIKIYSEAIELAPQDHLLVSNRSHAYAALDCYKEALRDAEIVINLRPDWPKGYFRKGCALFGLGKYEESVVALLQCLALDSSVVTAKEFLSKALHNILSPLPPDDPKAAVLQQQLNPTLLDQLIESNFNSRLLLPTVTVDTVRHLRDIITDTIATATNFLEGEGSSSMQTSSQAASTDAPTEAMNFLYLEREKEKCNSEPTSRVSTPVLDVSDRKSGSPQPRKRSLDISPQPTSPTSVTPSKLQHRDSTVPKPQVPFISPELLSVEEFECSLCYRLLYQPVTTPCGHTFCRQCLDRCLDHRSDCPLCKQSLADYLAERRQAVTQSVEGILENYFAAQLEERKVQHEEEMSELTRMGEEGCQIPIFVCTLAYPSVPCPLHIFEPRYRLMVRQCMESGTRQFGMCTATGDGESDFSDYGTVLEIREVQFFPDGRSLLNTIGGRRFKVLSRSFREGYNTAKVELLKDSPVPEEEVEELKKLADSVNEKATEWFGSLPLAQKQQIQQHLGDFPQQEPDWTNLVNGPAWVWWMIAVLPLDPRIQLAMVAMVSLRERLQGLNRVLSYLRSRRTSH